MCGDLICQYYVPAIQPLLDYAIHFEGNTEGIVITYKYRHIEGKHTL